MILVLLAITAFTGCTNISNSLNADARAHGLLEDWHKQAGTVFGRENYFISIGRGASPNMATALKIANRNAKLQIFEVIDIDSITIGDIKTIDSVVFKNGTIYNYYVAIKVKKANAVAAP